MHKRMNGQKNYVNTNQHNDTNKWIKQNNEFKRKNETTKLATNASGAWWNERMNDTNRAAKLTHFVSKWHNLILHDTMTYSVEKMTQLKKMTRFSIEMTHFGHLVLFLKW